jgi:hypothetical protein
MARTNRILGLGLSGFLLLAAAPGAARAGLVSLNVPSLPASADGFNITRDTSTGLEWLDVAVSAPYTFQTIQGQFASGGAFPGFRYATDLELWGQSPRGQVDSLFKSAGLGGGLYLDETTASILDSAIVDNGAIGGHGVVDGQGVGDGAHIEGGAVVFKRTRFRGNRASNSNDDVFGPYSTSP